MDFRTEWSSWLLVLLMMIMSYLMNPWCLDSFPAAFVQIVGYPLASIAIACIPIVAINYFIKRIPDIDDSIRLAFLYILAMTLVHYLR